MSNTYKMNYIYFKHELYDALMYTWNIPYINLIYWLRSPNITLRNEIRLRLKGPQQN